MAARQDVEDAITFAAALLCVAGGALALALDPAPKYPLTSVVSGISETTVNEPISVLTAGGLAVNVHKSASDLKDYVACGDLSSGM